MSVLDHPVWHALRGPHASIAQVADGGLAARYPAPVSPLAAVATIAPDAFAAMRTLVSPGETIGLFTRKAIQPPSPWEVVRVMKGQQMVGTNVARHIAATPAILGRGDVTDMLTLTEATKPGPFLSDTITMGHYVGLRSPDGQRVAMAGERLQISSAVEISAVCTDPRHRGRGYASLLVSYLAARIAATGRVPFLHVMADNPEGRLRKGGLRDSADRLRDGPEARMKIGMCQRHRQAPDPK